MVILVTWSLWLQRNRRMFRNDSLSVTRLVVFIWECSDIWSSTQLVDMLDRAWHDMILIFFEKAIMGYNYHQKDKLLL
jgi:hypothetical protein